MQLSITSNKVIIIIHLVLHSFISPSLGSAASCATVERRAHRRRVNVSGSHCVNPAHNRRNQILLLVLLNTTQKRNLSEKFTIAIINSLSLLLWNCDNIRIFHNLIISLLGEICQSAVATCAWLPSKPLYAILTRRVN